MMRMVLMIAKISHLEVRSSGQILCEVDLPKAREFSSLLLVYSTTEGSLE